MSDLLVRKTADISDCGSYRYRLTREWSDKPLLPFVMLNPSDADAEIDDPTIRRCMGYSRAWGFGGIVVGNLYAFRTPYPATLWKAADPYGPLNDEALTRIGDDARGVAVPVICAWGAGGGKNNRPIHLMQQTGAVLKCLGRTKSGQPKHPLYLRSDQALEPFP